MAVSGREVDARYVWSMHRAMQGIGGDSYQCGTEHVRHNTQSKLHLLQDIDYCVALSAEP